MNQFSLVEIIDRLGQGIVVTVALAAHSRLDAGFCQTPPYFTDTYCEPCRYDEQLVFVRADGRPFEAVEELWSTDTTR